MPSGAESTRAGSLREQLARHSKWRSRAVLAVHDFRAWLRSTGAGTPEADGRLHRALTAIENNRLRVAVAGADGRGKTELVNALFFADCGRRLLPTPANGSLCPVEIHWQPADGDACLRLLPIEYRDGGQSLAALKASPELWVRLPLHTQEPEQIAATLSEIHRTKPLPTRQAARLGLADAGSAEGTCHVPSWRCALLSFPHPLLRKGLVLLDLPGLAATARDPALHHELLASADALVMTVAADRGCEPDDLTLWQDYVRPALAPEAAILVALTRADLLGPDDVQRTIRLERLTNRTAKTLDAQHEAVHSLSARDGLAAKIADRPARRRASGIDILESRLAAQLIGNRRRRCRIVVDANIGALLRSSISGLAASSAETDARIRALEALDARCEDLAASTLERTRRDEQLYLRGVQQVQHAQRALREHAERCRRLLSADTFERIAGNAQTRLADSWWTPGLRLAIRALFDELRLIVAQTSTEADKAARQVEAAYKLLRIDIGLDATPSPAFSPSPCRHEMDLLHAEALRFANSGELLLTEQGIVIARLQRGLVQRARVLIEHLHDDWSAWTRDALGPLMAEVERRKARAEQRLSYYQRIKRTRDEARAERAEMSGRRAQLAREWTLLRNIRNALDDEPRPPADRPRGLYLVRSGREPIRRSG